MLVGSPVHFVLNLFEEQNRAFSMGIIINAGCIDFQNLSPEYFFGRTDVSDTELCTSVGFYTVAYGDNDIKVIVIYIIFFAICGSVGK